MKRLLILAAVGFALLIPATSFADHGGCGVGHKAGAVLRRAGGAVRKVVGRLVHPFRRD